MTLAVDFGTPRDSFVDVAPWATHERAVAIYLPDGTIIFLSVGVAGRSERGDFDESRVIEEVHEAGVGRYKFNRISYGASARRLGSCITSSGRRQGAPSKRSVHTQ